MMWRSMHLLAAFFAVNACHVEPPIVSISAATQSGRDTDARLDTLFGSHADYREFFQRLKQAVAAVDKNSIAEMIDYPMSVDIHRKTIGLRSKQDLVAHYDQIFTPKLINIVEQQTSSALFAKDQGVMIGEHGEIWFAGLCKDKICNRVQIKITALNLTTLSLWVGKSSGSVVFDYRCSA